jgi:hypothetical protein
MLIRWISLATCPLTPNCCWAWDGCIQVRFRIFADEGTSNAMFSIICPASSVSDFRAGSWSGLWGGPGGTSAVKLVSDISLLCRTNYSGWQNLWSSWLALLINHRQLTSSKAYPWRRFDYNRRNHLNIRMSVKTGECKWGLMCFHFVAFLCWVGIFTLNILFYLWDLVMSLFVLCHWRHRSADQSEMWGLCLLPYHNSWRIWMKPFDLYIIAMTWASFIIF